MDEIYTKASGKSGWDKAGWAEKKKQQRRETYELLDRATETMKTDPTAFQTYLQIQGRFDRYSVTNAILIAAQAPDATDLRESKAWRADGEYPDKGAKGILILEPGSIYTRKDGKEAQGFDVKTVYDFSQTSARFKPQPEGEALNLRRLILAMMDVSPVPFDVADTLSESALYDAERDTILLAKDQPEEFLFIGIAREIAAAAFFKRHGIQREASRFESNCVVRMLLARYDASGDLPLPSLPDGYAGMENVVFRKELSRIREVYADLQVNLYRKLKTEEEQEP